MGGRTLRHSCAQFKFFFFGPKILIEIPAHTIGFRVLLCIAMASNRILWFAPASITELGYFQVNLTSWPTRQAVSGQHCGLAGCSWPAYPSLCIDTLSLCQLNSYQQPFKSRALGYSSIGPGWSAAALASGRPALRWTSASTRSMLIIGPAAGDVMAGAGGAAGPAPDVRHQPPGTTVNIY